MKKFLALAGITLFLSACTPNTPPPNQAQPNVPKTQRVTQTNPQPQYNQSPQATANRLAQLASRVKKVKGATAVVAGKWAVVGIDIDDTLDRPEVGVIKYSVAEALKEDPQGANAIVTANPDIVQRLRELSADMQRGRPVKGVAEELADIVGRIMPQFPRYVQPKDRTPTVDEQKMNRSDTISPKRAQETGK